MAPEVGYKKTDEVEREVDGYINNTVYVSREKKYGAAVLSKKDKFGNKFISEILWIVKDRIRFQSFLENYIKSGKYKKIKNMERKKCTKTPDILDIDEELSRNISASGVVDNILDLVKHIGEGSLTVFPDDMECYFGQYDLEETSTGKIYHTNYSKFLRTHGNTEYNFLFFLDDSTFKSSLVRYKVERLPKKTISLYGTLIKKKHIGEPLKVVYLPKNIVGSHIELIVSKTKYLLEKSTAGILIYVPSKKDSLEVLFRIRDFGSGVVISSINKLLFLSGLDRKPRCIIAYESKTGILSKEYFTYLKYVIDSGLEMTDKNRLRFLSKRTANIRSAGYEKVYRMYTKYQYKNEIPDEKTLYPEYDISKDILSLMYDVDSIPLEIDMHVLRLKNLCLIEETNKSKNREGLGIYGNRKEVLFRITELGKSVEGLDCDVEPGTVLINSIVCGCKDKLVENTKMYFKFANISNELGKIWGLDIKCTKEKTDWKTCILKTLYYNFSVRMNGFYLMVLSNKRYYLDKTEKPEYILILHSNGNVVVDYLAVCEKHFLQVCSDKYEMLHEKKGKTEQDENESTCKKQKRDPDIDECSNGYKRENIATQQPEQNQTDEEKNKDKTHKNSTFTLDKMFRRVED